jgi:hypothetical protein
MSWLENVPTTLASVGMVLCITAATADSTSPTSPTQFLGFDGKSSYLEVQTPVGLDKFSVSSTGLTVAAWMRPDTLRFTQVEGKKPDEKYVHWLGKGEKGTHEWTFRMYSLSKEPLKSPRANRVSFYVFNPDGNRGCGSSFKTRSL